MPFSALQAAEWCGGKIEGAPGQLFDSMESMELAGANQMTFIGTAAYGRKFDQCPAGGAVCREGLAVSRRVDQTLIIVPDADLAVAEILGRLAPLPPYPPAGIHPTAVIDDSASVGAGVRIGPRVFRTRVCFGGHS